jgi:hypothetical protein
MPPSKAPSGPGRDGSERRVDFGNSRTAAPVDATPPQQLADMLELREATQGLSLAQLEARYKGRFHDGDIKEMKHEFENMARASQDRSRMGLDAGGEAHAHPGASFLAASHLEELVVRIERTSSRQVDTAAVQKYLVMLLECRGRPTMVSRAGTDGKR